jgi:hypothetical protein
MARTQKNTPKAATAGFVSDFPQVEPADLFQAFNVIAWYFASPETSKDGTQVNALAYQQASILKALCYNLNSSLQSNNNFVGLRDKLAKQQDDIRKHLSQYNGTEIWENRAIQLEQFAQKLELQLSVAEEGLRQAMRAYEKFTGIEYVAVTTARAMTGTTNETVLAMQEKYGKKINNPTTKGTAE